MLRLKMADTKDHPSLHDEHASPLELEDIFDRLQVMRKQEKTNYKCRDYLADLHMPVMMKDGASRTNLNSKKRIGRIKTNNGVDEYCREQIVEWSFRVVDYFHINREIVAISTSFLDRFLAECTCNRKTFKLVATTALNLAIKLNESHKGDMMNVLSDLSRGEFSLNDITEMETAILEALSWHLHPPTSRCFIEHILKLLPASTCPSLLRNISAFAAFFADLSLCEYRFTMQSPSIIAFAAILNSMEILNLNDYSSNLQESFVDQISVIINLHHESQIVREARKHLWLIYERSEQFCIHDEIGIRLEKKSTRESYGKRYPRKASPVCVSR